VVPNRESQLRNSGVIISERKKGKKGTREGLQKKTVDGGSQAQQTKIQKEQLQAKFRAPGPEPSNCRQARLLKYREKGATKGDIGATGGGED